MELAVRIQPDAGRNSSAVAGDHPIERPLEPSSLGDHLDRLYRAAWALCGSREDADDLVQETYARVLARPRLLRNEDDLGYLLRALRNTFLTQKRTESRRVRTGPLPEQLELVADPNAREPQAALEAGELHAAVAALPDDFRDVLVGVDVTGLSYKEAARALRIPTGTVMSRLYRARQEVVRGFAHGAAGDVADGCGRSRRCGGRARGRSGEGCPRPQGP
jgi:RNA polymerase sigma-70 factor, ECF subfamily